MIKIGKLTFILAFIFVTVSAYSFQKETRDVDSFDEIGLSTHADLYLKIGPSYSVVLEGDDDDIEAIETEVSNGRLRIKNKDRFKWGSWSSKVKVYITMPKVNGLYVSGSGDIIGESSIESDNLEISISGSGSIDLDIKADEVDLSISGSGDAELSGNVRIFDGRISGSGTIEADELSAKNAKIRISGSGSTSIDVSEDLDVKIAGSGNVYYTGNPDRVNANSSGSGKVRKRG